LVASSKMSAKTHLVGLNFENVDIVEIFCLNSSSTIFPLCLRIN
jgi:hypothetical protein